MNARYLLTAAAAILAVTLVSTPDAEARRSWRQSRRATVRYARPATTSSTYQAWQRARRPSTGPVTYSGVSRAEQDYWRRQDAWYEHAYGGWRPGDFR